MLEIGVPLFVCLWDGLAMPLNDEYERFRTSFCAGPRFGACNEGIMVDLGLFKGSPGIEDADVFLRKGLLRLESDCDSICAVSGGGDGMVV